MNDKQWEMLFDLMEKASNLPGTTAAEKAELIRGKAVEMNMETWLDEFCALVEE